MTQQPNAVKRISKSGAQGDVLFLRVDHIPETAKPDKRDGPIVVAHSETGHHHSIEAEGVIRYDAGDSMVCYLQVEGDDVDVIHHRSFDTHATLRLEPGKWAVRRQREYSPQGWRRVED